MIKGSILQEDIPMYMQYNDRESKYMRQTLRELQGELHKSTIIVEDFSSSLSVFDRSSWQKISKDAVDLNSTINHFDLINVYRILHSTAAEYTFFLSSHGTFIKIDHSLDHKTHQQI